MGSASDYAENKILELLVGKTAFATPTVAVALCTADPTDAGTGAAMNEVADASGYARVATAGDWAVAASGAITNANAITFPEASGAWGTVTHFALLDSATHGAGNILVHGALTASKTITSGQTPRFPAGDLDGTCT